MISTTQDMFVHELAQLYDAEYRFIEGQREMARNTTDRGLREAIENHISQTEQHARNLEEVFGQLGEEPQRDPNEVAKGLISDAQEGIRDAHGEAVRDYLISAAVARVEHFEIGSYRSMVAGARLMGQEKVADLLGQNMSQEEETARTVEQRTPILFQKVG